MPGPALPAASRVRRRVYEILDVGSMHDLTSRAVHAVLIVLVIVSVSAVILESVPAFEAPYATVFQAVEVASAVVFTAEYALRLWAGVEHGPLRGMPRWRARIAYALTPGMLIDLVAVVPILLTVLLPDDFRVLLVLRLIRFFKLTRYSPGMRSLLEAIHEERRALAGCVIILGGLVIVAAAAMHVVERSVQPAQFGSIPAAMWWAIVTLTTVGYGDVVPATALGKVIAGVTALFGLIMLALPVGLLATAFAEVVNRRDFVVTWSLVARVPAFAELDAPSAAEVMRLLHSELLEPGEMLAPRDTMLGALYFVAYGEVDVDDGGSRNTRREGDVFGEARAGAAGPGGLPTVRALTRVKLLVLDAEDLELLMQRRPDVRRQLERAASARVAVEGQGVRPPSPSSGSR